MSAVRTWVWVVTADLKGARAAGAVGVAESNLLNVAASAGKRVVGVSIAILVVALPLNARCSVATVASGASAGERAGRVCACGVCVAVVA